jgi:hypothetical protein
LHVENLRQHGGQNGILAVLVTLILRATVVAIIVAAMESRPAVIAVLVRVYIITGIAVGRVLVGIRVAIATPNCKPL